jgi:ElaB/YqjD/DUF883 family membrane-anchored ribosome-binding protein
METSDRVTAGFSEGGSRMASAVEKASTGAHNAIDKVSEAAHPAMDRLSSGAHHTVDKAASAATQTAAAINVKRDQLRYARARTMDETRAYVRANPMTAVGSAVGVGYLISQMLRYRKK